MNWIERIKEKWIVVLAAGIVLIGGIVFLIVQKSQNKSVEEENYFEEVTAVSTSESAEAKEMADIYVDIKGAVRSPGMYQVEEGSRLIEAIEIAGGFTEEADQNQLNFALKLEDQQVIYVPKVGEESKEVAQETAGTGAETDNSEAQKVNINTADETELQTLSGIGVKKAQEIIAYREANGSFKDISELTKVSGIGEKTVEKIKDYITI